MGYYLIAFFAGLMVGLMFHSDSLGGIAMTDNERRRVIGLIRRAAAEREAIVILWKDGVHVDMVTFPEREF